MSDVRSVGRDPAAPSPTSTQLVRLLLWCCLLAGALVLLELLGRGPLGGPRGRGLLAWISWMSAADPLIAGLAVTRLVATLAGWYLVAVTALTTLASLLHARRRLATALILTVPGAKGILRAALGLTLASGVLIAAHPTAEALQLSPIHHQHAADAAADPETGAVAAAELPPPPALQPAALPGASATPPEEWMVGRGDHFWSIAEQVLADRWGRPPRQTETEGYWVELIAANRERLVDRGNPDLLLVGQRLRLPAVP